MASCDRPELSEEEIMDLEMRPWSWRPLEKDQGKKILKSVYFRVEEWKCVRNPRKAQLPRPRCYEPTEDQSFPSIFHWFVTDFKDLIAPSSSSTTAHGRLSPIPTMPPDVPDYSTAVATGSRIYVIGGLSPHFIRDLDGNNVLHAKMFFYDTNCPEKGWNRGPSMIVKRQGPFAAAVDGKLYVFGGNAFAWSWTDESLYGEVFDPLLDKWELLPPTPFEMCIDVCPLHALLLDTYGNRHLLFNASAQEALFSYNIDAKSWDLFDPTFGCNINIAAALDGVLYCYKAPDVIGYDLINRQWFSKPVKGLGQGMTPPYHLGHLLQIGDGKLCLIWGQSIPPLKDSRVNIHCTIFTVRRLYAGDEEAILFAEVESSICYNVGGVKLVDCLAL